MRPAARLPCLIAALLSACGPPRGGSDTTSVEVAELDGLDRVETSSTPPPAGRAPTMQERLVIERLARVAERVRDLTFKDRVRAEVHDRRTIVAHLTEQIEDDDVRKAEVVYTALGLLPEDVDVRDLLERVLGEQVVGYYDHEGDRLVIREDVMRELGSGAGAEARVTIVHELVHALQDQRLALGEEFDDEDRDSDPESAYHAVVEGDATLAMIAYVVSQSPGGAIEQLTREPQRLRAMMSQAESMMGQQELGEAPAILRVTLLSSYVDGLVFAASLHGRGGWGAVDAAHRVPPRSTEAVLHPNKYFEGELPDPVTIPDIVALSDAGLEVFESDTLGELEMKVYFGQATDSVDDRAAAGWSGDRVQIYRRDGDPRSAAVVWFTTWDDLSEATEAEAAARRVMNVHGPAQGTRHAVVREGRAVLILRHLELTLHPPVVAAFTTFASGLPAGPPSGGAPP